MTDLESMRRKDPQYLKSLLNTRINTQKMLNNTLCEVMTRDPNSKAIESLNEELSNVSQEIINIQKDINSLEDKGCSNDVEYSFYDSVGKNKFQSGMEEKSCEEDKKNNDFYDSIIKQNKAAAFIEASSLKGYDENSISIGKDLMEEVRNTADSRMLSNRFLVNLKDELFIPQVMINSVSFDLENKSVLLTIYDFVASIEKGVKMPILEVLKYKVNEFYFTIDHLKASGDIEYVEYYSKCKIESIYRSQLDYSSNDFAKIKVLISYNNVEYETTD